MSVVKVCTCTGRNVLGQQYVAVSAKLTLRNCRASTWLSQGVGSRRSAVMALRNCWHIWAPSPRLAATSSRTASHMTTRQYPRTVSASMKGTSAWEPAARTTGHISERLCRAQSPMCTVERKKLALPVARQPLAHILIVVIGNDAIRRSIKFPFQYSPHLSGCAFAF